MQRSTIRLCPGIGLAALLLALHGPAAAQVYRTVGPDGKVSYSDSPPPAAAKSQQLGDIKARAPSPTGKPNLRKGMWEIERTFNYAGVEKPVSERRCTDPMAKMDFWQDTMGKVGCTFEPMRQTGNRYTQASECTVGGLTRQYQKTLTVDGDAAYTIEEAATGGGKPTMTSVTRARRLGDC